MSEINNNKEKTYKGKALLNTKMMSDYLSISEYKCREILRREGCPFAIRNGNQWLVNKLLLDQYIKKISGTGASI